MSDQNRKPEATLSDGAVKVALWKREGPKGPFYSATFSKSYRDSNGDYQNSDSFTGADLLKLSELSKIAYHRAIELQHRNQKQVSTDKKHERNDDRER